MSERESTQEEIERAVEMGWQPLEEFKGDPEKHRPAHEWLERGEKILPIVNAENRKLREEMKAMTAALQAELKSVREQTRQEEKAKYEEKLQELQELKKQAYEDSDLKKYDEVQQKINSLKKPEEPQPGPPPEFTAWHEKNPWYALDLNNPGDADIELSYLANAIGSEIAQNNPGLPPDKFYDLIEKRVKELRKDKFSNPRREQPNLAEPSGAKPSKVGKKQSWSDLPPEAKSAFARLKPNIDRARKEGSRGGEFKEYTKEEYVKSYFEAE